MHALYAPLRLCLLLLSAGTVPFFSLSAQDCDVDGGSLTLTDGTRQDTTICAGDGQEDLIDVTLTGAAGDSSVYVITNDSLEILALAAAPPFNLEGAGDGTCLIWHLSFDSVGGATIGARADSLTGCFDLSDSIRVVRNGVNAGRLAFSAGGDTDTTATICAGDTVADPLGVTLSDDTVGANRAWVITDTLLNILALPSGPPFDLNDAGPGVCYIWYLAFADGLTGAAVNANAADLGGCFDLSNPLTVVRDTSAGCVSTSVSPPLDPDQVILFPNPAREMLFIDLARLTSGITTLAVYDATGRQLLRQQERAANGRQQLDLSGLPAGTYFLRVTNDGRSLTRRFIH